MPLIPCITKSGLADEAKMKELSSRVEDLVKQGKHVAEAEAIVKREFINEKYRATY
jgi:hypothetical protein